MVLSLYHLGEKLWLLEATCLVTHVGAKLPKIGVEPTLPQPPCWITSFFVDCHDLNILGIGAPLKGDVYLINAFNYQYSQNPEVIWAVSPMRA